MKSGLGLGFPGPQPAFILCSQLHQRVRVVGHACGDEQIISQAHFVCLLHL